MEKNIKEINLTIEGEKWEMAKEQAYKTVSKKVKVDGFRAGKAPKEKILKEYGENNLYMDAADLCLQEEYAKMLEENKDLEIVAQPELELNKIDENGVEFKVTLTLKPEVKLGKYKGLKVKKEKITATKKEINETIQELLSKYSENVTKKGKIVDGNIAIIDFEGFLNDVAFEGGKGENYSLTIGSNTFIPGFEEQLIGMKTNEEKDINVTFPADYHSEDLKGKEVVFKVKVNEIKEIKLPEFNEDFFSDLNMEGVDSKETLEAHVKENILAQKEGNAENQYIDSLLDEAAKSTKVEIPEVMINEEIDRMIKQYTQNLQMQGLTLEQFYQYTNSDEAALREQMQEEGQKRVKTRLMLEQIMKEEKIEISDEEANNEADVLATKYQMEKEEFLKAFGGLDMIKYDLEMRKAIEVLKSEK
ncbi:MAG: trigger factor [Mycoplasmatota bacterium]